ncbi:MAG: membrane dipeptidase [Candidatus Pelethousia sp.]|nr:membrane dipeptidase [Candidatus Pelethousia sp.]
MLFDIHGDIWTDVTTKRLKGERDIIRRYHLDRFRKGGQVGGVFVIWIDPPYDANPKERIEKSIRAACAEIWENQDILSVIRDQAGFYKAVQSRKQAIVLALEGLSAIDEQVDSIYTFFQMGFKQASLTWNEQNALATGVRGDASRGLTAAGKEAVCIMQNVGMILDVSHANDRTFWDIAEISHRPFIASHSNARALCDVPRNLTDAQIRVIGESGGLVGINAFHEFVHEDKAKRDLDHLLGHLEHIVSLIGIDHVALGFDFFEYLTTNTTESFIQEEYEGTIGLEDISKGPMLVKTLEKNVFGKEDIEKI